MDRFEVLSRSPLFAPLPEGERVRVAKRLARRRYEKDDYLFFEGDPAERLVLIAKGRVKVIKHSEGGRETILATFGPGEVVGEVGVLVGETYPATAQALEPVVTLDLPRREYARLVQAHPALAWAIIEELGRRLQRAHETIRSLAVERVERRVARVLLRMAAASGQRLEQADVPPGAVRITTPLSRQDIADMAGTVVETAIRTMSRFQKRGWIATQGRYIILLRPHQLVLIAEELQRPPALS